MQVLKFKNSSYNVSSIVSMYSLCQVLARIVILHLIVIDLFMNSLSGMILCTLLGRAIFSNEGVFA